MRDLITAVLPPKSGDFDAQSRWQWAVFMKLWLLILFAVWALDLIPGFRGLARASEVQALSAQLEVDRIERIETSLFELRVKQCAPDIPVALRQAYGEQLSKLLRAYHDITGGAYNLLSCSEIR